LRPLVSVIIPAYNRGHTIENAIRSVQQQTYSNWEAVVVDDGSTDDTVQIVKSMAKDDNRIRLILHSKNRGAQAARNTGIKSARGSWVSFLDSDDEWLPESLSSRLRKAFDEKVAVVHSGSYILENDNKRYIYRVDQPSGNVYSRLLVNEYPMFPALLVTKRAMERIKYLDERIVSFQEWDTFIRLAKVYSFGFVPEPTFVYDNRTQNAISRYLLRAAKGYEYVVKRHFLPILLFAGRKALIQHYRVIAELYLKGGDFHMATLSMIKSSLISISIPEDFASSVFKRLKNLSQRTAK
jgi:glycosyltransferase involved in cell wall biosynthesis